MDRMRVGLTGLGLVFLATLAASVALVPVSLPAPKEPSEPLAQLGVAPSPDKGGALKGDGRAELATSDGQLPRAIVEAPPAPMASDAPEPLTPRVEGEAMSVPDAALSTAERQGQRPRPA